MPRPYFVLVSRDSADSAWGVEFGDYDKETVQDEREAFRDTCPSANLRILRTGDKQADIDSAVAALNRKGN